MAVIHCMCGYIGFGKTTVAKQLEIQYGAKRFTPDEVMIELYGTDVSSDFMEKANNVNSYIWNEIEKCLKNGQDVIFDAGSWGRDDREYVMYKAKEINADVIWHQVECSIETAKKRALERSLDKEELSINEDFFDKNIVRYEKIAPDEQLDVVYHKGE
ncbi:MAG: AAA family ATPase [Alphaproteobacteria bacterium]|nr:AAA family ATPase [Alphaproteobacteria bacterium]